MDGIVNKVFLNLLKVVGKYVGDEIRVGLSCWGSGRDKSDGIIIVIQVYDEVFQYFVVQVVIVVCKFDRSLQGVFFKF